MSSARWCILIHQLPVKPLYLRAKIRRRLARAGAVPIKNSVYVLPRRDDAVGRLQGIAADIVAGGGEAFVCEAGFVGAGADEALVVAFQAERDRDYRGL